MSANLKSIEGIGDIAAMMRDMGAQARLAARRLALATPAEKDRALRDMAQALRGSTAAVLAANAEDLAEARKGGATAAFLDRLEPDAAGALRLSDLRRSGSRLIAGPVRCAADGPDCHR